jgi:hypothetical protein
MDYSPLSSAFKMKTKTIFDRKCTEKGNQTNSRDEKLIIWRTIEEA